MTLENSERIWLDEFWSLWQRDQPINLEELEQRDIWAYPRKEAEPTDSSDDKSVDSISVLQSTYPPFYKS